MCYNQGSGCAITREVVIAVGNGVLSSRCPEKMATNGGNILLSAKWVHKILLIGFKEVGPPPRLDWVQRGGTTAKT